MLWPNIDAGSDHISKVIRQYRTHADKPWMRTLTNLTPENYLKVLATAACAVGNSSSFVRDAGYFGTPVVLVGNRQNGRETDEHAIRVPVEMDTVAAAVSKQLEHGRYAPSKLYGDGQVSERIAEGIARLVPYKQKQLAYTLPS
jgi:UDP-N-acetylglucosamine 2-epimerase